MLLHQHYTCTPLHKLLLTSPSIQPSYSRLHSITQARIYTPAILFLFLSGRFHSTPDPLIEFNPVLYPTITMQLHFFHHINDIFLISHITSFFCFKIFHLLSGRTSPMTHFCFIFKLPFLCQHLRTV